MRDDIYPPNDPNYRIKHRNSHKNELPEFETQLINLKILQKNHCCTPVKAKRSIRTGTGANVTIGDTMMQGYKALRHF